MVSSDTSQTHTRNVGFTEYAYLQKLATLVPEPTFYSHQTVVKRFSSWRRIQNGDIRNIDTDSVAAFLDELHSTTSLNRTTADRYLDTLVNLIAYHQNNEPGLVKARILAEITNEFQRSEYKISECDNVAVETVLVTLRQRRFGTRTHTYIELILATCGRPKQVRLLNLSDIDPDTGKITLRISNTSIVGRSGLVETRSVSLNEQATKAINEFLDYERKTCTESQSPLFSTTHGRVSPSSLRRSFQDVKAMAIESPSRTDEESYDSGDLDVENRILDITFADVWRYALAQRTHNE